MNAASQWLADNLAEVIVAIAQANVALAGQPADAPIQQAQPTEPGGDE
ncbi:hypothetical protein [Mycobacterium sp. 1274761.0]|nr:hypothetical protein [Mycobacterium sp. 1274761.0]